MSHTYASTMIEGGRKPGSSSLDPSMVSNSRSSPKAIQEDIQRAKHLASLAAFTGYNREQLDRATSPLAPISARRSNVSLANQRRSPPSISASRRPDVYELPHKPPSMFRNSTFGSVNGSPDLKSSRCQKLPKDLFRPGMIIRGVVHEQDFHNTADGSVMTIADKYTTESKFGLIHSKYRKMIVVALFENHYLAIPLYTHNGNGVSRKSRPDEYISVRDHRSRELFTKQTEHGELITEEINAGIYLFDPNSLAHITHPVARKYNLPLVVEGYLKENSAKRLWTLFNTYFNKTEMRR